jgi:hypothetical protein
MTVRTDQLALVDLGKNESPAPVPTQEPAQVSDLRGAGKMIPCHRGMMEDAATVGARAIALELAIPHHELEPMALLVG